MKERTSETHFYALLSMVAGAVIGRRPEKKPHKKDAISTECFFYWSALKMTKCQPLKEFSELVLPKKRLRMKKVKVPELVLLYSRNSSNTLIFQ